MQTFAGLIRNLTCGALACLFLLAAHAARADDYPSRPIKLLVGAPPGGTTDTIARAIAGPISAALKQSVIVENRPGAGGNLAAETVAKAKPDGYTLLVSFSSHTINASLYTNLPYDPAADFTAITKVATVPSLLIGNPKLPAKDLKSLIALAKVQPGKLTIGIRRHRLVAAPCRREVETDGGHTIV
jgi:tripartite-type tricarboxylate transporter receptor subunit TctC